MDTKPICKIEDCSKPSRTKGMCSAHYQMWWKHGDPLGGLTKDGEPRRFCESAAKHKDKDACLIWPYGRTQRGYGQARASDGRRTTAHRIICELAHGKPPSEDCVAAHSCGKGHHGCVNPHHLRWATCKENSEEMVTHGTSPRGSRSGHAKLSEADVKTIRKLRGLHDLQHIAERFGVSRMTISDIHLRKTWRHI